ncbi:MAG: aminoacyl-tRNA hydrolase [Elusimicrobia bacterium RIFOXYD12_FULL_66_9]|nr:MAG: aminoacyl-tRNA hydrolase [Elusimicrobia bacterium RIFOXYD12_FULL_66_9]
MALRLVVGLGNPGSEYERTRHNVGFRLADRLVGGADAFWKDFKGLGVHARWGDVYVAKPMTFMNESGQFVRQFAAFHNISVPEILVVYDEISLPLGKIRLRKKGSAGGQKGMLSILHHMDTQEVSRLRIGIGPQPEKMDSSDFVLSRFKPAEEDDLNAALDLSSEAVKTVLESGVDLAMNRFNPAP